MNAKRNIGGNVYAQIEPDGILLSIEVGLVTQHRIFLDAHNIEELRKFLAAHGAQPED
jgi:Holliday junction resolvase